MCQATVYLARDGQANERIMEAAMRDLEDAIEHLGGQANHTHSHHHHDHISH